LKCDVQRLIDHGESSSPSCEGDVSRPLHFSEVPEEYQKGFKLKDHISLEWKDFWKSSQGLDTS